MPINYRNRANFTAGGGGAGVDLRHGGEPI